MTTRINSGDVVTKADGEDKVTVDTAGNTVMEANSTGVAFLGATPVAQQAKISDPTGGATTDTEARAAINAIIDVLEAFGLSATS